MTTEILSQFVLFGKKENENFGRQYITTVETILISGVQQKIDLATPPNFQVTL